MNFDTPINSNDQSFERVLRAGVPVLAVFGAGALDAAMDDALKQIAKANAGKLIVVKIRADENPDLVKRFSIRAPTLLTFKEDNEYSRAEMPTPNDAHAHADYLLGRGAIPQRRTIPHFSGQAPDERQTSQAASANGESHPIKVTDTTFAREVLGAALPVMVDFWAPWCGPCRMIAPALEKLAREYTGRVRIAKLNVDENPRTQAQYQVQGIPTLLLVKNGKVVDRIVGALPEAQLRMQVERLLRV